MKNPLVFLISASLTLAFMFYDGYRTGLNATGEKGPWKREAIGSANGKLKGVLVYRGDIDYLQVQCEVERDAQDPMSRNGNSFLNQRCDQFVIDNSWFELDRSNPAPSPGRLGTP